MRIQCLQHVAYEGPACIRGWAARGGHELSVFRPTEGDKFPALTDFDLLIVLGGPYAVYDHETGAWLAKEKAFIKNVIARQAHMLGICLGAQLAAEALGAAVFAQEYKEIGWFRIVRSPAAAASAFGRRLPVSIEAFHWHGDTFDLPDEAVQLASSDACKCQGFSFEDRIVGLQFHLEPSADWVDGLIRRDADQLVPAPFIQTATQMTADDSRYPQVNKIMDSILDEFALQVR